jgi:hypothetical protein
MLKSKKMTSKSYTVERDLKLSYTRVKDLSFTVPGAMLPPSTGDEPGSVGNVSHVLLGGSPGAARGQVEPLPTLSPLSGESRGEAEPTPETPEPLASQPPSSPPQSLLEAMRGHLLRSRSEERRVMCHHGRAASLGLYAGNPRLGNKHR